MNCRRNALGLIFATAILSLASLAALGHASSQNGTPPAAGGTAAQLTPYSAPDNSASAGVPPGWKVTKGAKGVIQMSGPQGEAISLGNTIFVRNGAFQAGQQANGLIAMSMPYQATLNQKYVMLWQQASASSGQAAPQVNFISATPIPFPKNIAECAIYLGTKTTAQGTSNFESRFCSLPLDSGGIYRLFWMNADIPAALAKEERATAEAVLTSYKIVPATLKLLFQPYTPIVTAPRGGGGLNSSTIYSQRMADQTATCMDLGVIREEPQGLLPSYCR
jgi:hypothetical protein